MPMLIKSLHKCRNRLSNVVHIRKETRFKAIVEIVRRKISVADGSRIDGHFDGVDDVVPANTTLCGNA